MDTPPVFIYNRWAGRDGTSSEMVECNDAKNPTNFAFISQGSLGPPGIPGVDGLKVSKLIYTEFL